MIYNGLPVLGMVAWSGTGKTTLLTQVIPLLKEYGYRIGIIKHVHHQFDIDKPGKDSYKLRKSGADQIIAASRHRMAFIRELEDSFAEPALIDALSTLHTDSLDLILVEGYKHEAIDKIELNRSLLNKPLLFPNDKNIFAIICDNPDQIDTSIDILDINKPKQVADYIDHWIRTVSQNTAKI